MADTERFITVGKLGRYRGVRGKITVTPITDFPDRFLDLEEIYVGHRGTWQSLRIESAEFISGRPVLKFEGIDSKEEVALLTNRPLAVTREQLVELPEDVHYVFDLVGCEVFDRQSGDKLGEITDVLRYPANDAYVVKVLDGTEVLFPAVTELVKHIDIEAKRIEVDSAGMFRHSETQDGHDV